MAASPDAGLGLRYDELLFLVACACNCWGLCLCVCMAGDRGMRSSWRWQFSRAMRLLLRWCRPCSRRGQGIGGAGGSFRRKLRELWGYARLLLKSLYFNSQSNCDTLLDCVFEPVYWIVDHVTRWFGVVFVTLVILLTGSVVVIVYLCLLPVIFSTYPTQWIVWHLTYGHWVLVMVLFHYYKATTTSSGNPPKEKSDIPSVTICKKCIIPKPARTHHCSICNTCILKMDHHCPWLNNCVGHFNHRYFFSFCAYMTLGCVYCSVSSKAMFLEAYGAVESYRTVKVEPKGETVTVIGLLLSLIHTQSYYQTPPPMFTSRETLVHKCVIFLWVLTSSVTVALGGLTLWHAILISRGETSVERHINRKEAKRLRERGKVFRNPYHFGCLNNWKVLLGVEKSSHWVTRVLLPSSHPPHGDGITWDWTLTRKDLMAI